MSPEERDVAAASPELLRDIVALTAVPMTWVGKDPARMAESLADAFTRALELDAVVVWLESDGQPGRAITRGASTAAQHAALKDLEVGAAARLARTGTSHGAVWLPLGAQAEYGVLGAWSGRADFPTPVDRYLLSLGTNQAALALRFAVAERALDDARRQLAVSEKMSALGQLVSGVAHEIRTPLTYATNHLYLIQHKLSKDALASIEPHIDGSLEAMDRINQLVGGLRRYTQLRPDTLDARDMAPVVKEAVNLFRAAHQGRVQVVADLRTTTPIALDRVQLQQVVLNLLENAADAMPNGGRVTIRTGDAHGMAELVVEDKGSGMPADIVGRIFEPFFTTKTSGMGLGLSIVRRIVERHHGTLDVQSQLGEGTRIVIRLPWAEAPPQADSGASHVPVAGTEAKRTSSPKRWHPR